MKVASRFYVCEACGHQCQLEEALLEAMNELKVLFPDTKWTTSIVWEWCGALESKYMIRKVMEENFYEKRQTALGLFYIKKLATIHKLPVFIVILN